MTNDPPSDGVAAMAVAAKQPGGSITAASRNRGNDAATSPQALVPPVGSALATPAILRKQQEPQEKHHLAVSQQQIQKPPAAGPPMTSSTRQQEVLVPIKENDRCDVFWRQTVGIANTLASATASNTAPVASTVSRDADDGARGRATKTVTAERTAGNPIEQSVFAQSSSVTAEEGKKMQEEEQGYRGTPASTEQQQQDNHRLHVEAEPHVLNAVVLKRRPSQQVSRRNKKRRMMMSGKQKYRDSREKPAFIGTHSDVEDLDALSPDEIEYYVHYAGQDRRLDDWITYDMFQVETLERHSDNRSDGGNGVVGGLVLPDQGDSSIAAAAGNGHDESQRSQQSNEPLRRQGSGSAGDENDNNTSLNATPEESERNILSGGNWHTPSGDPTFAQLERDHEEKTRIKNIERIVMGEYEVDAWYFSEFPEEYSNLRRLYVCQYCLTYMKRLSTYKRHLATCSCREPPGKLIYREDDLCVYEMDGKEQTHKVYCQKLCLLAKLFLDHKTLFYDVTPFFFYVVAKVDDFGAHVVGYFSKEKISSEGYNLACILTFPQYQKSGYGKFIISLSYELTKREGKTGSPEKPLSDLGKVSYRSYWKHVLMNILAEHDPTKENISIGEISERTGIKIEDIISTLQSLDMIKVWKGQHVVYVKQSIIEGYMKLNKKLRLCKGEFLNWEPPLAQEESAAAATAETTTITSVKPSKTA